MLYYFSLDLPYQWAKCIKQMCLVFTQSTHSKNLPIGFRTTLNKSWGKLFSLISEPIPNKALSILWHIFWKYDNWITASHSTSSKRWWNHRCCTTKRIVCFRYPSHSPWVRVGEAEVHYDVNYLMLFVETRVQAWRARVISLIFW